tara:strand:- start:3551 stop:4156 length:606 start_codon:yes stop_codon:yes gene_type:complete
MNRYCKKLNLPKELIPRIDMTQWNTDGMSWYQFHKEIKCIEGLEEPFHEFMESLNIYSRWMEIFYTPPHQVGIIHSDTTDYADWSKIVFQTGAKGSTMRWWESNKTKRISTSIEKVTDDCGDRTDKAYHGDVLMAEEKDSKLVHEQEINECCMTNVGPLHSSYNPTDEKRFVFTYAPFDITTKERILWDDALERFKPYIDE